MPRPMLRGAFTALVTPFTPGRRARRRPPSGGSSAGRSSPASTASCPCGTTGESPTLSDRRTRSTHRDDRRGRRRTAVPDAHPGRRRDRHERHARPRSRATRRAAELGADAALVVAPYYNRPDGRMLEAHFRAVADEGDLPIVVYNVPSRTGSNVDADTFLRLAEHPRVVGVKEASGNLEQIARICARAAARRRGPRRRRRLDPPVLALGGDGVVSVAEQRDPRAARGAVRGGAGRGLGRGPADPRALAAAVPGQLPGCPEPGAGQGRARRDGAARRRRRAGAAAALEPDAARGA